MDQLPAGTEKPFVSRTAEMEKLHDLFARVIADSKPRILFVSGDFGVGKTELVKQFIRSARERYRDVELQSGEVRCSTKNKMDGLFVFKSLLDSMEAADRPGTRIKALLPDAMLKIAPAWINYATGGLLDPIMVTAKEMAKVAGVAKYSEDNVFNQFSNLLEHISEKHPVIAFIDDIHWADETSLQLLFHLSRNLSRGKVLIICAYRSNEPLIWRSQPGFDFNDLHAGLFREDLAQEMKLERGINVSQYLRRRYPQNAFSTDAIQFIQQRTGGHALFVEELFTLWQNTGTVAQQPTAPGKMTWVLTCETPEELEIPDKVEKVLSAILLKMEKELREVLSCASVEGENFTAQVLKALEIFEDNALFTDLDELENRYLFIRQSGSQDLDTVALDFYRFAHPFFREHVYRQLSPYSKRELHRRVADCMEKVFHDTRPIAGQLALSYKIAREFDKAAHYALQAAANEQEHYAWTQSERWCEFGIKLLERLPEDRTARLRLDFLIRSGYGFYYCGKFSKSQKRFEAALPLALQLDVEPLIVGDIYSFLGNIADYLDETTKIRPYYTEGHAYMVSRGMTSGRIWLEIEMLEAYADDHEGDSQKAIETYLRLLGDMEKMPPGTDRELITGSLNNCLGVAYGNISQYANAVEAYRRAKAASTRINNMPMMALSTSNLADILLYMGEFDQALQCLQEAQEISEQCGDADTIAYIHADRGSIYVERGNFGHAVKELNEALSLSIKIGSSWILPWVHVDLALAYLALNNLDLAFEHASQAVQTGRDSQPKFGSALQVLALVENARGDWVSAEKHFKQAIGIHTRGQHLHDLGKARLRYAECLLARGEQAQARQLASAALALFEQLNLTFEIERVKALQLKIGV